MTQPWYPFYWSDYSGKTFHLTQGQHGAYFLLMRYIYTTEKPVPNEHRYSIAQAMDDASRSNTDSVLQQFFKLKAGNWHSNRCEEIIDETKSRKERYVNAGKQRWKGKIASHERCISDSVEMHEYPQPQPQPQNISNIYNPVDTGGGSYSEPGNFQRVFDLGVKLFPQLLTRNSSAIHQWLKAGCDADLDIISEMTRLSARDPGGWDYFTKMVMNAKATRTRPPPEGTPRTRSKTDDAIAEIMKRFEPEGELNGIPG